MYVILFFFFLSGFDSDLKKKKSQHIVNVPDILHIFEIKCMSEFGDETMADKPTWLSNNKD